MAVKLNNSDNAEIIGSIKLTKEKYPIAFANKVQELIDQTDVTQEEAESLVSGMEIELEIYYSPDNGLFAVETDAVEAVTIYDPYTGEVCEEE